MDSLTKLYTTKELAEATGYPYRQLWTYLKRGTLPPADYNVGNKPLWKKETVDLWLEKKQGETSALRN